ncbi:hypothetical protein ABW20_dc0106893 [Dactylellina cionopaga]|nr:hypothetical protein ABW20_dc0106893 [Dactylellina cionopaga]
MALEEFPPNREFWGRNFNGGEVIQLVLKNPHNGMWLPMQMIQAVMLHELAHNKEMNHSRRFHKHRLGFVAELSELKFKGYTGEGFWGQGRSLHPSADLTADRLIPQEELPEELCGGVYRREKRKKKEPKKKVDYQEQKRRRIIKKFGSLEGNAVGTDEDKRQELEKGKKLKGKPRVAGSARGRDLRAEAALKRFESQKKDEEIKNENDSATESDSEEEEGDMIKLEDDDVDMKAMLDEMSAFACGGTQKTDSSTNAFPDIDDKGEVAIETAVNEQILDEDEDEDLDKVPSKRIKKPQSLIVLSDDDKPPIPLKNKSKTESSQPGSSKSTRTTLGRNQDVKIDTADRICVACQVMNSSAAITCVICSNVLRDDIASWSCKSNSCKNSDVGYRNSTDVSYCGVCGTKKIGSF